MGYAHQYADCHAELVAGWQVVLEEEDEAAVRAWVEQRRTFVKRLPDAAAPDRPAIAANGAERRADGAAASSSAPAAQTAAPKPSAAVSSNIGFGKAPLGAVVRKRKAEAPPAAVAVKKQEPVTVKKQEPETAPVGPAAANGDAGSDDGDAGGLAGLLGGYGSSGSDSPAVKAE